MYSEMYSYAAIPDPSVLRSVFVSSRVVAVKRSAAVAGVIEFRAFAV